MKVKAKHWINYNGAWHKAGETFEVEDFEEVKDHADKVVEEPEQYVSEIFPPVEEQPKRRGRPKKTEE